MNIALVCTEKLPVPPVAGGAIQIYIDGIIPYLALQHNITVFCIRHPMLANKETVNNVKYIRLPAKDADDYVKNVKAALTDEFDLIHVFNRPYWISHLSTKLPDTKFSLSLHNEMFRTDKIPALNARACVKRVEFINTVSRFIAKGIKKLYPEAKNKLNVVYSGADIDKYKPLWSEDGILNKNQLKAVYNIQNYKVVLFVGRLSIKKGADILLKAMKKVMKSRPDVALVIIGSKWYGKNETDDYTKSLNDLSKDLKGPILFTGFLPPSEIPSHYNLGDIFVCPSQWDEPLARVHYEAMAAGLPIITTNRGGNAEVVSGYGNGLVINDYSNPNAFADNINYLLDNPSEALEMGKTGRKLAEERYNWKSVAQNVLQSFDRINIQPSSAKVEVKEKKLKKRRHKKRRHKK